MLDRIFKKDCWSRGCTNCSGRTQSNNNFDDSFEASKNGSRGRQSIENLAAEDKLEDLDVSLRLVLHHGIPTTSRLIAYNPLQHMLAIATKDGQIKVFTHEGMESLLQSSNQCAIRFLEFFNSQGLLVCANVENVIEVWDTNTLSLIGSRNWNINVTALAVIQHSTYFFVGDASGTVSVIQYDSEKLEVTATAYAVSLPQVFGDSLKNYNEKFSVKYILPQPSAEHERVLICYANGVCVLWSLHDGEVIAGRVHTPSELVAIFEIEKQGVNTVKQLPADNNAEDKQEDVKEFTCVCWSCAKGGKFVTGYSDGDVWLWSIAQISKTTVLSDTVGHDSLKYSSTPLCKLNTGLLVPISLLRWWEEGDYKQGKEGFLCALGGKNVGAYDVLKVISLNNACLLRPKCFVELEVPGHLADCMPVQGMEWSSSKADVLLMALGSEGKLFAYNVKEVYESFSSSVHTEASLLTRPVSAHFSLSTSAVTATKSILLRNYGHVFDYIMKVPRVFKPCLWYQSLELNRKSSTLGCKQAEYLTDSGSEGCYLYLTGHEDGVVNFWDLSSQITSLCGLQFQENRLHESMSSMRNASVSCLDFCSIIGLLAIGYADGLISLHKLNLGNHESSTTKHSGKGKEGQSVFWSYDFKFHTHQAAISCIVVSSTQHRVAAGCETGKVSLIDTEKKTVLYSGNWSHNKVSSIISLNFVSFATTQHDTLSCFGSPIAAGSKNKKVALMRMETVVVTTEDSEVFVLDGQSGAPFKSSPLKLKNPSSAVSMHVLDISGTSLVTPAGYHSELPETTVLKEPKNMAQDTKTLDNAMYGEASTMRDGTMQYLLLLCSEDALRLYRMPLSVKGVCSSLVKVKVDSLIHWASTFQAPNKRVGLALIFKTGKLELRSLPRLNLLQSIPPEGFLKWGTGPTLSSLKYVSCTSNGCIALHNDDGEFLVFSVLDVKHDFRCSKLLPVSSKAVEKGTGTTMGSSLTQKKKKTLGNVLKATNVLRRVSDKGNKVTCHKVVDLDYLFTGKSSSFSVSLQSNDESPSDCSLHLDMSSNSLDIGSSCLDKSSSSLDIDDIEIDDEVSSKDVTIKPKNRNLLSKVKKNMKGKEKMQKLDSRMNNSQRPELEKSDEDISPVHGPRTIHEIKAAYGQGKLHSVTETASGLRDKVIQRGHRLQDVDRKTADMQEGAQQFHKLAEELFKAVEEKNKRKFF